MNTAAATRINDSARETIKRVLMTTGGLPDDIAAGYADMICKHYEGETIYFAIREWQDREGRDDRIRAERRAGRSLTWLAQQFCISRTQVRRICGELRCERASA